MTLLPQPLIRLVDDRSERREGFVQALQEAGLSASQHAGVHDLPEQAPSVLVALVSDRVTLESLRSANTSESSAMVVLLAADASVDAATAFALGAADVMNADGEPSELLARVRVQLDKQKRIRAWNRRIDTERLVHEISKALGTQLDMRGVLSLMVKRIAEVVEVDRVSIVIGAETETAYVVAASDDEDLRDLPIRVSDYPEIEKVLQTDAVELIHDTEEHPLFRLANVEAPTRFRSAALIPIRFDRKTLGVLFLRRIEPGAFDERDMRSLNELADSAGIALHNAQLWETLQQHSEKTQSEHERTKTQIRELKQYVDFFDSSADGILVIDLGGKLSFCNPAACELTGRTHEQLHGSTFLDVLAEDGHERYQQLQERVNRGEVFGNEDLPIVYPDGQRRMLNVSVNNMLNAHGGLIVSFRDVTADRAIARELAKTKEFLQCVIDSSVDAIVSSDTEGTIRLFNPAAERIYGYAASEVIDEVNVRALYPKDHAFEIMTHIRSDEWGGVGVLQGYETRLLGRSGEMIPVQLSASLIMHRGRPIGSVGVFKDLRATQRIQARLAETQQALQRQEKKAFIAELAGATAHELNQPLTAVMGYADMLLRQVDEGSRIEKVSRSIMRETERMAEIVRKIGKLTKYETKAYVGETKIIDIERATDSEPPSPAGLSAHLPDTSEETDPTPTDPS